MRSILTVTVFTVLFAASGASAQSGRTITGTGQTKPPSRSAAPPATRAPLETPPMSAEPNDGKTEEQTRAEVVENIRRGEQAQRARDRAADELMARWEFAVCVGCNASLKPFRRVWTNPLRVLAGIPALEDDKRRGRLGAQWASLIAW